MGRLPIPRWAPRRPTHLPPREPVRAICGNVLECGRPLGHRGHHGGFRPILSAEPVARLRGEIVGQPLTAREVQILRDYALLGDQAAVAHQDDLSPQTVKNHLTHIYAKLGATGVLQALGAVGWLTIPDQTQMAQYDASADYRKLRSGLEAMRARALALADALALALADAAADAPEEPPPAFDGPPEGGEVPRRP